MAGVAYVIASPHPDDAAASLGGTIARHVEAGREITVLTLCAGRPAGPPSPLARSLHALWGDPPDPVGLRRDEDRAAARHLGARLEVGELLPAMYRVDANGEPRYGDIFGAPHPDDADLADAMADLLAASLPAGGRVLCPLAARGHVDHLAAADAGLLLRERGARRRVVRRPPVRGRRGGALACASAAGGGGGGRAGVRGAPSRAQARGACLLRVAGADAGARLGVRRGFVRRAAAEAAPPGARWGERVHGLRGAL